MELFVKVVNSLLKFLIVFFDTSGGPDLYVNIGTSPVKGEKKIVPFARTDIPDFGEDHAKLVSKAEELFSDDNLRHKWLMAVHRVRQTDPGWIMDRNTNRPKPKWGLTHRAA